MFAPVKPALAAGGMAVGDKPALERKPAWANLQARILRDSWFAADLSRRYAFAAGGANSLIGRIAVAGLALSVAVLIAVLSIINGFEREFRERVFGVLPHAGLHGRAPFVGDEAEAAALAALPSIVGAAPFAQGAALAVSGEGIQGVLLTGVEPSSHQRVSALQQHLVGGDLARLQPGEFSVVLGARLAARLGVGQGDGVLLMLPLGSLTPAGLVPRQKRFKVVDLLRSGSELDGRAVFVHLADAQRLFRLGAKVHGYQLKVADLDAAQQAADEALALLGDERFYARTWMGTHGNLHQAIGSQKASMFVLLAFLVGVAAFNLVSTLVMAVERRGPDIAILKTLGASTGALVGGFTLLGALIGGLGVLLGVLGGCALAGLLPAAFAWVNDGLALDLMNQYFIDYLPVDVWPQDVFSVAAVSFGLCLVCALYPAWRAARLLPSRALAHE